MKTLFCSSVAMNLNLTSCSKGGNAQAGPSSSLDLILLGDFGSGNEVQMAVARTLTKYATGLAKKPDGMLLLGDNFYGPMTSGGVKSARWKTGFEDIYPASVLPGPCWAILGNHDYHDTPGNEEVQLAYAASTGGKTRWTMPGKYYRLDLPVANPQVTFLMIDTNWPSVNRRIHNDDKPGQKYFLTDEEMAAQSAWLEQQLNSPRAPFTVVVGHHPLYSEGKHGDTPHLVKALSPLFEKHGVHMYLCGHDHDLQHLELEGLRTSYVVSGGGGARLYLQKEKLRKGSTVKDVYGFSHMSLAGGRLHVRHIDANGTLVHAFSKGTDHSWKVES